MIISNGEGPASSSVPFEYEGAGRREADHRIANSLQLLSALLSSQCREVSDPDARAALETSVQRIGAIAGVHRQLYKSPGQNSVDLCAYLMDLLAGLQESFSCEHRQIHLEADPVNTPSEFASVVGIIVTELVINACKHAYAADQHGSITVTLAIDGARGFILEVRDRGRGRRYEGQTDLGLGSRIIDLMTRQLGADARYAPVTVGTSFVITGGLPST
ncbi:sensor histidine kinase [Novosphingobium sp. P6W]|uniref:sensor histidine kinase n=1 Tax=Novosphingobium sp. P6W TaxID=1609758 RepID=UPI0006978208|nr:sensor histidine kinase [Novosphingobium sp. P6W]AXB80406.1 sensor histidine kinase [Novosphingobium sp. P6W]